MQFRNIILLFPLFLLPNLASANFLNDLSKKLQEKVEKTAEDTIGKVVDKTSDGADNMANDALGKTVNFLLGGAKISSGGRKDILGIQLGMNIDAAIQAIQKHDANIRIERSEHNIPASSDKFLSMLYANNPSTQEQIHIYFAPPPAKPTVIAINRAVSYPKPRGIPLSDMTNGLQTKYGPCEALQQKSYRESYSCLIDKRRKQCSLSSRRNQGTSSRAYVGGPLGSRVATRTVESPKDCSPQLTAEIRFDKSNNIKPVSSIQFELLDIEKIVTSYDAYYEHNLRQQQQQQISAPKNFKL